MPVSRLTPLAALRPGIAGRIQAKHPALAPESLVGDEVVNAARLDYVRSLLEEQLGDLTHLDEEVVESLQKHEVLSVRPGSEGETGSALGVGERLADHIASFGGSWKFILAFCGFLVVWILANAWMLASRAFDPYPFILLNLILSCLAALQAPVIMMSQNRQEEKDRERAKKDYMINLKSELEIRTLHEKVDHFIMDQQQELLELQKEQVNLMNDILKQVEKK